MYNFIEPYDTFRLWCLNRLFSVGLTQSDWPMEIIGVGWILLLSLALWPTYLFFGTCHVAIGRILQPWNLLWKTSTSLTTPRVWSLRLWNLTLVFLFGIQLVHLYDHHYGYFVAVMGRKFPRPWMIKAKNFQPSYVNLARMVGKEFGQAITQDAVHHLPQANLSEKEREWREQCCEYLELSSPSPFPSLLA